MRHTGMIDSTDTCGLREHPRYFPMQLITDTELTLEQNYFRDKLRRHNLFLHGWGVVCGAAVCRVPIPSSADFEPWKVKITPGYIIGPYGDEIYIDCEYTIDIRTGRADQSQADPFCSEPMAQSLESPVYVAVKYKEIKKRPVRVQPVGCGCDETRCEYSRLQDSYEVGILPQCPESHRDQQSSLAGCLLHCPPCPSDPWVVLARVEFEDDGTITTIDPTVCRRSVTSHASPFFQQNYIGTWLVLGPILFDSGNSLDDIINIPEGIINQRPVHNDGTTAYRNNRGFKQWKHRNFVGIDWNNIHDIEDSIHQHLPGNNINDPFDPNDDTNFAGKHRVLAFFLNYIRSPGLRQTRLFVRSDDAIKVFLNNKEITDLTFDSTRDILTDFPVEQCAKIELNPSDDGNVLLIAVAEENFEWGFSARIENDRGLRITTDKSLVVRQ
jgi:hypothetical protein